MSFGIKRTYNYDPDMDHGKVIIAGSRNYHNYDPVAAMVDRFREYFTVDTIISGAANGVDSIGMNYANRNTIPLEVFPIHPSDWERYGKRAGHLRNQTMAERGDILLAFVTSGNGTRNMIENMQRLGKPIITYDMCDI